MKKIQIVIEEHEIPVYKNNEPNQVPYFETQFIAFIEGAPVMVVQSDTAHGALRELATSMEVLEQYIRTNRNESRI